MKQWGGSFLEILNTLQNTNPTFKCFGIFNYELRFFTKKIETIKWWMMDMLWFWTILIKAISISFHLSTVNRNIASDKNEIILITLYYRKGNWDQKIMSSVCLKPQMIHCPEQECQIILLQTLAVEPYASWWMMLPFMVSEQEYCQKKNMGNKVLVLDFISGCSQQFFNWMAMQII